MVTTQPTSRVGIASRQRGGLTKRKRGKGEGRKTERGPIKRREGKREGRYETKARRRVAAGRRIGERKRERELVGIAVGGESPADGRGRIEKDREGWRERERG